MNNQRGFTLIELMVVVGIVAVLSAIGIPAYQNYLRKAALTDMLQLFVPYRTAVELCVMELGSLDGCNADTHGIPPGKASRYVKNTSVTNGVVTLTGQNSLAGLSVTMTPKWTAGDGISGWIRSCTTQAPGALVQACESVFHSSVPETSS